MADFYATQGLAWNLNRPQAEALLDIQLKNIFYSLPDKLPGWEKDVEELSELIKTQNCPNEYFDFLGHGAFKEVYMLHRSHNYTVKFCSQQNDTETEQALLEAAKAEGIEYAFIPTYFVKFHGLTCGMPLMLEDYDGSSAQYWDSKNETFTENKDWQGRFATALEIQPTLRNTISSDEDFEYWNFDDAYGANGHYVDGEWVAADYQLRDPAIDPSNGEVIPLDVIEDLEIHNKRWIEEFVRFYGLDGLMNLADFVAKYHVSDLHNGNLGYVAGPNGEKLPVIVDWLSWGKHSIEEIRAEEESYKKAAAPLR